MKLDINITLDIQYDENTHTYSIHNNDIRIIPPAGQAYKMRRVLGTSEIQYGILTLGSKSVIGKTLPRDMDITVIYNKTKYPAHSHKTSSGRIDRLSALIKQLRVGDELEAEYNAAKNELYLRLIK